MTEHPSPQTFLVTGVSSGLTRAVGGAANAAGEVRVVPVSQVRGLEFDAVVVADPDGITRARPGGERDLYVALTRPTRRLVVVG
ncbi:ATP-binding domain-containing protein [Promicromonospora citrea]|uniref:ATP-binding domain-containing protein n=1 Tax=Promicromonospora citrea TaxID=43677 RepID=UPI002017C2EB|nr:ATP-binding domain-containing protein [Promicromonospora citrea]